MRRELAGLIAGLLLVVAVLLLLDVGRVVDNVRRARTDLFVLAVVLGLAGVGLLGAALRRLRRTLEPAVDDGAVRFFGAFLRAYFVRLIIPVGSSSAPAIYAYVLHHEFETTFEEELALGTAAELLSYGASAAVALVGMVLFLVGGGEVPYARPVTASIGVIFGGVVAAFVVLWHASRGVDRVVLRVTGAVNRSVGRVSSRVAAATADEHVRGRLETFHETTALLGRAPRTMAVCGGLTVLAWLALSAPLYLAVAALDASAPFALVMVAVPVSGFLYVLPVSGGLGGVEVAVGTLLVAGSSVTVPQAAAAVLLYRVATYWTPLAVSGIVTALGPTVPEAAG